MVMIHGGKFKFINHYIELKTPKSAFPLWRKVYEAYEQKYLVMTKNEKLTIKIHVYVHEWLCL